MSKVVVVEKIFELVGSGKYGPSVDMLSQDVEWHLCRPASMETVAGRDGVMEYFNTVAAAAPQDGDFVVEHVVQSGDVVFSLHTEGKGTPTEHRHVLVFRFDGDDLAEVWELTLGGPESNIR